MALKKDLVQTKTNFDGSLIYKNGYWKIDSVLFSKDSAVINIAVYTIDKKDIIDTNIVKYTPALDDSNALQAAYKHLKTLPEFSDAIDC